MSYGGVVARGWGGDPPQDDDEARSRILGAAVRCVDRYGPEKTGLSDVATELGVTRQTVYRHFASTDDLLLAVAATAADGFLDRLARHVAGLDDPAEAFVEGLAFTFEQLPKERLLGLLLTTGRSEVFLRGVTSAEGVAFSRQMLDRMAVDWEAAGYRTDGDLDALAGYGLRMLQSIILEPPPRTSKAQLRAYLRRWFAPAIVAPT